MATQETQVRFSQQRQWFLGAHPWTDTAKAVWVETQAQLAAGKQRWQTVDYVSQNEARKSPAERTVYQVCEVSRDLPDPETGELYPLRWIFSHSSAKAAQDARQRDKALAAGEQALRRLAGLLGKYDYTHRATIEVRLEQALRKAQAGAYFSYTLRGSDGAGDFQLRWRRRPGAIRDAEIFDGVALLCTNVPAETWAAPTVMIKYKQQVVAEQAFDFIKSPVQIRPTCTCGVGRCVVASTETLGRVDVVDTAPPTRRVALLAAGWAVGACHAGHLVGRLVGVASPTLARQTRPTVDGRAPRSAAHRAADGGSLAARL